MILEVQWKTQIGKNTIINMKTLTKRLQIAINEGVWGYSPQDSDHALDTRNELTYNLFRQIIDLLKNEDENEMWSGIAVAIDFTTALKDLITSDDVKMVNNVITTTFDKLIKNTEWQNTFDDPEAILNSVKNAQKQWNVLKNNIM
jgi:hypothetical protein